MNNLKTPELSQKVLLGEEVFLEFRKVNRFLFFILTGIFFIVIALLVISINYKELELGLYIGVCALIYCIVMGMLATKSKKSAFSWVFLAFITSPVAFIPSHIMIARVGLKQEWL